MTIAVIDYQMGNLHSVAKALEHVSHEPVIITADISKIRRAKRIVLPGQGAMRDCLAALSSARLKEWLIEHLSEGSQPLLGICVGQQMLLPFSEENGGVKALDFFKGRVNRFNFSQLTENNHIKVPHMGWNEVFVQKPHFLWQNIPDKSRFYFVHSYYVAAQNVADVQALSTYASTEFVSAIGRNHVFAVQFHPEKSAASGLQLLHNFSRWSP